MALAGLGPWNEITPQFFTSAMERGASLGLSARKQDEEETAADRLKLAYDQLASDEKIASAKAQAELNYRNADLLLRAHANEGLQAYRQQESEARQKEAEARQQQVQNAAATLLETAKHHRALEAQAGSKAVSMDPADKVLLTQNARDLTQTQRQLDKLANEPVSDANTKAMDALRNKAIYLRSEIARYRGPSGSTPRSKQEVTRTTKDGRKAVFDANTKQFLRYAEPHLGRNDSADNTGDDDTE